MKNYKRYLISDWFVLIGGVCAAMDYMHDIGGASCSIKRIKK